MDFKGQNKTLESCHNFFIYLYLSNTVTKPTMALFGVLPMVPLVILPIVPLVANGTIGRANGTIGITIGTNGITNGTSGRTLNDIGIPLVPLVEP